MTTKARYFLYLLALHLAIGILAYFLLEERLVFLLIVEVVLLLTFIFGIRFYRTFMAPTRIIQQGTAALKDGDFTSKLLPKGSKEVDGLVRLYNEMIDNLRRERTFKQERQYFLEKLMASAELGVILFDYDGLIDTINQYARRELGLGGKFHGQPISGLEAVFNYDLGQLPLDTPTILTVNGTQRFRVEKGQFIDQGFARTFLLFQDITSDLLAAEKEAYGKVIRMMAHEVNNSIGATNSMLNSLLDTNEVAGEELRGLIKDYLPIVIERSERMNGFMRNFASVIRLPAPTLERINLTEFIRDNGKLFAANTANQNISISYPDDNAPILFISADPGQLERVLTNALTNARESLAEQGGEIRLEVTQRPHGFIIADNGPGIPKELEDQLFTPFFSTKATGQGIGLTLSRDILEGHGAKYNLRTGEDGWTRFSVKF